MISIKSQREIDKMRKAGEIVALAHKAIKDIIAPGVTTIDLNKVAEETIRKHEAIPSFLNYPNAYGGIAFPGSVCASINEEVIHGIPNNRVLKNGDVVSIDIGAIYKGFHGDAARTWIVGHGSEISKKLVEVTRNSFFEGIKKAIPGKRIRDVSKNIQDYIESNDFGVVRDFVGHGIGTEMHEEPQIPNYVTRHKGPRIVKGMTLAIEPMVNIGTYKVKLLNDNWTVVTSDGKYSAHYENTILVTDKEPMILTQL